MPWLLPVLKTVGAWLGAKFGDEAFSETYGAMKAAVLQGLLPASIAPKRAHFRELHEKIREMPFIYKDLEGELLRDFVEIDMACLDWKTLQLRGTSGQSRRLGMIDIGQQIRDTPQVYLLGSAGIGKTTFLRHSIMKLTESRGRSSQFLSGEALVPFYVPLKSLDFTDQSPIVRFLLSDNRLLRGPDGLQTLTKLAMNKRLFLLLDGYDEVPFTVNESEAANAVHSEVERMVQPSRWAVQSEGVKREYETFYASLDNCRLWLTSRKEFFQLHRVNGDGRVLALELQGIGANRPKLVKSLFDIYRRRSRKYGELLDEEYFLGTIDRSGPADLIQLSYNPLFLTVMCYNYATGVIDTGQYDISIGNSVAELIMTCVSLLLHDLDAAKARGISDAKREAILRRRNEYPREKLVFLSFVALELLAAGHGSFNIDYINDAVVKFFASRTDPSSAKIAKESRKFSEDLVNSGLFVLAGRHDGGEFYDLPHRRFREVLAAKYFDLASDSDRARLFQATLERSDLADVLFTFSTRQDEILRAILEKSREAGDERYNVVFRSLDRCPPDYSPTETIEAFIRDCIESDTLLPAVKVIPRMLTPSAGFGTFLHESLNLSTERHRLNSLVMACFLLKELNAPILRMWLEDKLHLVTNNEIAPVLLAYCALVDWVLFREAYRCVRDGKITAKLYCYSAVRSLERIDAEEEVGARCRSLLGLVGDLNEIVLLRLLALHESAVLRTKVANVLVGEPGIKAALVRSVVTDPRKGSSPPTDLYFIAPDSVELKRKDLKVFDMLRTLKGSVLFGDTQKEFLDQIPKEVLSSMRVPAGLYTSIQKAVDLVAESENGGVGPPEAKVCYLEDLLRGSGFANSKLAA